MEQYYNSQQVIVEPVKAKKTVGLQTAALVFGIIGMVFAFCAYFYSIFSNVAVAVAAENYGVSEGLTAASGVGLVIEVVIALFCLVGVILGIVGLVKSILRSTRTVRGIVMSAIGLNLAGAGLALSIVGLFVGGFFRMLMATGAIG